MRNCIELPITDYENVKSISEIKEWLENYIKTCPVDYFDKVNRMRILTHRTVKYDVGDIFRFEIDREHYGYGLIIGKIRELLKQGVFTEDHPMHDAMTVPIMIRLYVVKTKNKNLSVQELSGCELLPADLMCDNEIIWGTHEIIGRKTLSEADIDFPIQIYCERHGRLKSEMFFAWGMGLKKIKLFDYDKLPEKIKNGDFKNIGVSLKLYTGALERKLRGEPEYSRYSDLLHPDNIQVKGTIINMFGLPLKQDFDCFNKENNGMAKAKYIELITK